VYGRNWTFRHFAIYNSYGGFGLTGLTQQGSYTDQEFSRPQRIDVHSGVIALGAESIYGPPGTGHTKIYHSQLIVQELNKDFRIKRISGVSADEPYSAWQFTGPNAATDANDNGLWEDCTLQWGIFSGSTRRVYTGENTPSPNDGDAVINHHTNTSVWQRIGVFGSGTLPTTVHNPSNLSASVLHPEHIVIPQTAHNAVYQAFNPASPHTSDYTIIHPSLTTAGANGTVCGADWSHLSTMLTGVRN
jgi:hypothetical protein